MIDKYRKLILFGVIVLASFLRLNQLNTLPALNADEAAIGYNVYSLINTGRDEHGHIWPIHFESFGDWKPGLFFYVVLPFVKLFGLNEWAIRIPGAVLGVGTVWLVYLLVGELFSAKNFKLLASFLLAISPWHIHFSRGAWEVNAGTFFIVLGVWAFLRWTNVKDRKWLFICIFALVASLYTYHAARIVIPLLVLGMLTIYRSQILNKSRIMALGILVGVILMFPLVRDLLGPAGVARAGGVSIFADLGIIERINQQRGEHGNISSFGAAIFHNKVMNYSLEFFNNWGEHFWGQFLFLSGDEIERNKIPEIGQLYLFQLPLLIFGLFLIARKPRGWGLIVWWLIVAPTAAALTFQSPHSLRSHNMVIPLTIISAYGMFGVLGWLGKIKQKQFLVTCYLLLVTIIFWDFSRYLHQYYVHMAKEYPSSSQYAVKELVSYVSENYDKYPVFAVTDRYDQPYILFLFYMKYPPDKFQVAHELTPRDKFGFSTVRDFDKFHFEEINKWEDANQKFRNGLIIGTDKEIDDGRNIIHRIYFPNGDTAFKVVSN